MKFKTSICLLVRGSGISHAATFYPIVGVTSDTAATDLFPASRMIEGPGVGFDAAEPHDRLGSLTWVTNAPNGGTGDYFGPTPSPSPRLFFETIDCPPLDFGKKRCFVARLSNLVSFSRLT